jgi:hypothetical protein
MIAWEIAGVGVYSSPSEQRAVDAVQLTVQADGLADGQNVPFVEAQIKRTATVPGGAESDSLGRDRSVRLAGVIGGYQSGNIDQQLGWCQLAGERTQTHTTSMETGNRNNAAAVRL